MSSNPKPIKIEFLREPVAWFAAEMEKKLAAKDDEHGGSSWPSASWARLFSLLKDEFDELEKVLEEQPLGGHNMDAIIEECADVANFAMMIADQARQAKLSTEAKSE